MTNKPTRTGGSSPPRPPTKPKGRPYTARDISDKVNKRLDEE